MRWLAAPLLLALAACQPPVSAPTATTAPAPPAAVPGPIPTTPLREAAAEAVPLVAEPVEDAVEAVSEALEASAPALMPEPAPKAVVAPEAVALMIRYEIISPAYYRKRLIRPIWPGGASGVTWCVGYDGGHQTRHVIAEDWIAHPAVGRLVNTAGLRGEKAKAALPDYRDIISDYPLCEKVFGERTLIQYERRTARLFRNGYDDLPFLVKGVLVSLVYNRGDSTVGDSRREMKTMVVECVPHGDLVCLAREFRKSKRVWNGSSIEAGMHRRREEEAALIEKAM